MTVQGAKSYEKTEDPIYALENNLPIDCAHYLEHQLTQPLMRIFEPVMKDARQLLTGQEGGGMEGGHTEGTQILGRHEVLSFREQVTHRQKHLTKRCGGRR